MISGISGLESVGALSSATSITASGAAGTGVPSFLSTAENAGSAQIAVPAVSAPGQALGFDEAMTRVAADMVNTIRQGEGASVAGISGEATTREVVDAVMSAERSLQTAIAVRDRIINAYLEISRMAM